MSRLVIALLIAYATARQEEALWTADSFPNPFAGDWQKCNMPSHAHLCDPDGVLNSTYRSRLDYDLQQLEQRTRQDTAPDFCQKKGITAGMALAGRVRGGSIETVKAMANEMLKAWHLDDQCNKSVVYVISTEDAKFWVARGSRVPIWGEDFTKLFVEQKSLFQRGDWPKGLQNIVQGTWELALAKKRPAKYEEPQGPQEESTSPFGKLSIWWWLGIVLILVPTIVCICCCCFCCCTGRCSGGEGGTSAVGGYSYGGGRDPYCTNNGTAFNTYNNTTVIDRTATVVPCPESPPRPQATEAGLYPYEERKDEGGGGSWN